MQRKIFLSYDTVMEKKEKIALILDFKKELQKFTHHVSSLLGDRHLVAKREFLQKVATDVHKLYESAQGAKRTNHPQAREIGKIVQDIFAQPLRAEGRDVSFVKAAEDFPRGQDLSCIARQYIKYPESARSFIRELELLTAEIETILEAM